MSPSGEWLTIKLCVAAVSLSALKVGEQLLNFWQSGRLDELTTGDDLNGQWLYISAWTEPLYINAERRG